jgi:hypothetical protein
MSSPQSSVNKVILLLDKVTDLRAWSTYSITDKFYAHVQSKDLAQSPLECSRVLSILLKLLRKGSPAVLVESYEQLGWLRALKNAYANVGQQVEGYAILIDIVCFSSNYSSFIIKATFFLAFSDNLFVQSEGKGSRGIAAAGMQFPRAEDHVPPQAPGIRRHLFASVVHLRTEGKERTTHLYYRAAL